MSKIKLNKKVILIIVIATVVIAAIIAGIVLLIKERQKGNPENVLNEYVATINEGKYEDLYNFLSDTSKNQISEDDFVTRNKNIYSGIEMSDMEVTVTNIDKAVNGTAKVTYSTKMNTLAGNVEFTNTMDFSKNKKNEYVVDWASKCIFPDLNATDKVRISTQSAKRGSILDRNGEVLAQNGGNSSVGVVPGKMNSATKDQDIEKLATMLGKSSDSIKKLLNASYVQTDTYVELGTITSTNQDLEDQLLTVDGVKIKTSEKRSYPYGEVTGHLVGYVQNITAEELEKNKGKGYSDHSVIGKYGLEKDYEDRLRGTDGAEIYIADVSSNKKETIAKADVKNGEDIKLTIDINVQKKAFDTFKDTKGCCVAMQPKTGEILALVSTPSFDSNDFANGMSNAKWQELTNNADKPLFNRYQATFAPGSSFKPVIAGIGVTNNKINPEENFGNVGKTWQKDASWGDYYVSTMTDYGPLVNMRNALTYSDNIYFAKAALKIGKDTLCSEFDRIGFNKSVPFDQNLTASQYADSNGKITSEGQLADTGYGQGKVLVNPVHMASIYSSFVNKGNMILPYLEYKDNAESKYYIENAFSEDAANMIKDDLIQVVEKGTAKTAKIDGITVAGKTGTAEIKSSKDDDTGTEIGWFDAFTADDNVEKPVLVIGMAQDVKDNGGSHYLTGRVRDVIAFCEGK